MMLREMKGTTEDFVDVAQSHFLIFLYFFTLAATCFRASGLQFIPYGAWAVKPTGTDNGLELKAG